MFAVKTLTGSPSQPEPKAEPEIIKEELTMQPEGEGWYCRVSLPCGAFVGSNGLVPLMAIDDTRKLVLALRGAKRLPYAKADAMLVILRLASNYLRDVQRQAIDALKDMPLPPMPEAAPAAKPVEPRRRKAA